MYEILIFRVKLGFRQTVYSTFEWFPRTVKRQAVYFAFDSFELGNCYSELWTWNPSKKSVFCWFGNIANICENGIRLKRVFVDFGNIANINWLGESSTNQPMLLSAGLPDCYFYNRKYNLGKFWRALDWKMFIFVWAIWNILWRFGIFYDHLVHFVFIWYIFYRFW
jgi:hypothetical protein